LASGYIYYDYCNNIYITYIMIICSVALTAIVINSVNSNNNSITISIT